MAWPLSFLTSEKTWSVLASRVRCHDDHLPRNRYTRPNLITHCPHPARSLHQGACLAIAKWCCRGDVEAWFGSVLVLVCHCFRINFEARGSDPFWTHYWPQTTMSNSKFLAVMSFETCALLGLGTKYSLQIVSARQLEDENSELDISGRCFCRGLISLAGAFTQSTSRHEGQIWFRVDWFDSLQTQPLHKDAKIMLLSGDVVWLCLVIPNVQTLSYLFLHGAVHLAAWCGKSVGVSQWLGRRSAG